jgi:DNA repair protein SbcC/Rad50
VAAAALAPAAQPAAGAAAEELARADDEAAAAALDRCRTAEAALASLHAELQAHVEATEPLRRRHRLWSELSRCLDGTGGDNALRMSLSSYVLAARLEQVAAAASERLLAMSGGRYSLEHTDEAERSRGRSGLALRVVDAWTGRRRDTASLSGGESFYTSLALALGLADVVTQEAGGAKVETLFVDEGFGSLDEETLQEVMDTLDGLRSGGRVVGLVSHVPDLRDRIPARLEVLKTRGGSTVRQASA